MKLGDDYQYPIKGSGKASYKLESKKIFKDEGCTICSRIEEEYSLHLCKMRVSFFDGQVLMCPKGKTINDATMIGEQDGGL